MTLEVFFWVLKGTVPSLFKVTTGNYSHTIRIGKSKVVTRRSTTANDFILWVGSQSKKCGSLCLANSR